MKVLMIGGGGREHALAWKLAQSPRVDEVLLAPGNAGTAREHGLRNVDVASGDIEGLLAIARREAVALTVVGPEAPLVAGVVDRFQAEGLRIFGPGAAAAQLEGSKAFSKDFLARHSIPTARYQSFTDVAPALAYLESQGAPIVIKADGLAAGKGVIVAMDMAQARAAIHDMLEDNAFGDAGARVVIEEYLEGEEASFIVMADGDHVVEMATSQDHKRVGDNDSGANTGGMGAYSPAPVVTESVRKRVMREIIMPTIQGMKADGHAYTGFLYAGLMIDDQGAPRVIEYNCRFGDPETQPIMLRLQSDLVTLCEAAIDGQLDQYHCQWDPRSAVGVVMAAQGYPGSYRKGDVITGFNEAQRLGCHVFHAGTRESENGAIETAGGRVLCVTALGDDVKAARDLAYEGIAAMQFEGGFYRSDIAARAINR
ncbi:phosphoribosylamine--glycine ligase [Kushneria konosiri]|uniref:Phosphoribosylamine--glycine ligase n=1 Tax=Kushneria konosiri TaxID=698828 RepID=A0A2Z2HIX9_9GAMM|nr:phosphoribosylamine--glycine ligase [Kushneria konosiri]ARS53471.1 phosphoribosylamine--glycine ligase [Kushneria konosiri]